MPGHYDEGRTGAQQCGHARNAEASCVVLHEHAEQSGQDGDRTCQDDGLRQVFGARDQRADQHAKDEGAECSPDGRDLGIGVAPGQQRKQQRDEQKDQDVADLQKCVVQNPVHAERSSTADCQKAHDAEDRDRTQEDPVRHGVFTGCDLRAEARVDRPHLQYPLLLFFVDMSGQELCASKSTKYCEESRIKDHKPLGPIGTYHTIKVTFTQFIFSYPNPAHA